MSVAGKMRAAADKLAGAFAPDHPSRGKGKPSCSACRGLGIMLVHAHPRADELAAVGIKLPGLFKCSCVDAYQAKTERRANAR